MQVVPCQRIARKVETTAENVTCRMWLSWNRSTVVAGRFACSKAGEVDLLAVTSRTFTAHCVDCPDPTRHLSLEMTACQVKMNNLRGCERLSVEYFASFCGAATRVVEKRVVLEMAVLVEIFWVLEVANAPEIKSCFRNYNFWSGFSIEPRGQGKHQELLPVVRCRLRGEGWFRAS